MRSSGKTTKELAKAVAEVTKTAPQQAHRTPQELQSEFQAKAISRNTYPLHCQPDFEPYYPVFRKAVPVDMPPARLFSDTPIPLSPSNKEDPFDGSLVTPAPLVIEGAGQPPKTPSPAVAAFDLTEYDISIPGLRMEMTPVEEDPPLPNKTPAKKHDETPAKKKKARKRSPSPSPEPSPHAQQVPSRYGRIRKKKVVHHMRMGGDTTTVKDAEGWAESYGVQE